MSARVAAIAGIVSVVVNGAIFGFFYAWVCSTMWGLDQVDPRVAIEAMNGMNASVRNGVFFVSFFLTPVFALGAAAIAFAQRARQGALLFVIAALGYAIGGIFLTQALNLPLNEWLASIDMPSDESQAATLWVEYSSTWQGYNLIRTIVSGACLTLQASALWVTASTLARRAPAAHAGPFAEDGGRGRRQRAPKVFSQR